MTAVGPNRFKVMKLLRNLDPDASLADINARMKLVGCRTCVRIVTGLGRLDAAEICAKFMEVGASCKCV